jgi:hypothetical protein
MSIHDWRLVDAAVFHSFHLAWISKIGAALNQGVLPSSHYALCERHRDGRASNFLELPEPEKPRKDPGRPGKLCYLDESPPQPLVRDSCTHPEYGENVITIRRSDFHKVVAAIRIVAPDIKRSQYRLDNFVGWAVEAIRDEISLLVIDVFPPGPYAPEGIHKAIWGEFIDNDFTLPEDKPLTLASYHAVSIPEAFVEPIAVHAPIVDMPVFLSSNSYVLAPLEAGYRSAFETMPSVWLDVLNGAQDWGD